MSETSLNHEKATQNINPKETKVEKLGNSTEILNRSKNPNRLVSGYRKLRDKFKRKETENIESPEINEESTERIAEAITDELTENRTQIADAVQTARELNPAIPENANEVVSEIIDSEEGKKNFLSRVKSYLKTSRGTKIAGLVAGTGASLSLRLGARAVLGPNFWVAILAGATAGGLVEGTKEFIKDRKRYDGDEIEARLEEAVLGFEVANKTSKDLSDPTKTVTIEPGKKISMLERAGAIAKAEEIIRSGRVQSENLQRLIGLVENARFAVKMETQKPEFKDTDEAKNEKNKIAFLLKGRKETLDEKLEKSDKVEVKQLLSEIETRFGKIDVPWKDRMKKVAKAAGRGALVGAGTAAAASLFLDCLPESWTHALSEKAQHAVEYLYGHATPELTAEVKNQIVEQAKAHGQEVYVQMVTNAKEQAINQTYQASVDAGHGITHAARDAVHDFYTNVQHLYPGGLENIDPAHMVAIENELARAKVEELGSAIVQPGAVLEFKGQAIVDAIQHAGNMSEAQAQSLQHFLQGRLSEHSVEFMLNHDELVKAGMNDYFTEAMNHADLVGKQENLKLLLELKSNEFTRQAVEIEANEATTKYLTAFSVSAGIGYGAGMLTPDKRQRVEAKTTSGGYSKELPEDVDKVEQKDAVMEEKVTANTPGDNLENPNGSVNVDLVEKDKKSEKRVVKKEKKGTNKYSGEELDNLRANWEKLRKTKKPYVSWFESVEGLHKNEKEARTNLLADMQWVLISVEQEKLADIEVINFCLDDELKGAEANKGFSVGERGKRIYIGLSDREAMQARLKLAIEEARIQRDSETAKQESAEKRKKDITELRAEYNTHSIALIPGISIKTLNKGNNEERLLANKAYEEIMKAGKEAGIFDYTDQIAGLVIQVGGYPPADSGVLSEKGFFIQDRSKENDGKINLEIVYPVAGTEKLAVLFKDALDSIKKRRPKKKEKEVFEPFPEGELNLDKIVRIIDAGIDQYSNEDREKYNGLIKARVGHEEKAKEKGLKFRFKQKIGGSYDSETSFPLVGAGDYKYEVIVPQEHEKNVETFRLAEQASALLYEGDDPLINLNNPEKSKKITALVNTLQKRFSEIHHIDPFKQKEAE